MTTLLNETYSLNELLGKPGKDSMGKVNVLIKPGNEIQPTSDKRTIVTIEGDCAKQIAQLPPTIKNYNNQVNKIIYSLTKFKLDEEDYISIELNKNEFLPIVQIIKDKNIKLIFNGTEYGPNGITCYEKVFTKPDYYQVYLKQIMPFYRALMNNINTLTILINNYQLNNKEQSLDEIIKS